MAYDYGTEVADALDSLGTPGRIPELPPEVARAVATLGRVLAEEYPDHVGLDEHTMYGELAVRVAVRFAREERARADGREEGA